LYGDVGRRVLVGGRVHVGGVLGGRCGAVGEGVVLVGGGGFVVELSFPSNRGGFLYVAGWPGVILA
jgi:hypothetical protein